MQNPDDEFSPEKLLDDLKEAHIIILKSGAISITADADGDPIFERVVEAGKRLAMAIRMLRAKINADALKVGS